MARYRREPPVCQACQYVLRSPRARRLARCPECSAWLSLGTYLDLAALDRDGVTFTMQCDPWSNDADHPAE